MSVDRSTIKRSAGVLTFGGATLYPERDINADYAPDFDKIVAWAHGRVDDAKRDFRIPVRTRLWGGYSSLPVLFPSGLLTPVPGTSLCSDAALVLWAKNDDRVTFHNAFIAKLIDLYIGVDKNTFAADVEFMCLIKGSANPEDAAAYFTRDTSAFSDPGPFAKTDFLRRRATLAWAGKTGFTSFEMREGVNISWSLDVQYDYSANYGTDNAYIGEDGLTAELRGIPAGPTLAQADTAGLGQGTVPGAALSSGAADLTVTLAGAGSHAIVLKNAALIKGSEAMGVKPLRMQEHVWRTTTGFSAGVAAARATVA
jgi:hypothetical protein